MHDDDHRLIDDQIDTVARSLTASPPPAALRSAVAARIAGRSGSSQAVRWSLGLAAAASVIVLAIVWPGREAPVDSPASRAAVANVPPSVAVRSTEQRAAAESIAGRTLSGSPGEPDKARPTQQALLLPEPTPITEPLVIESLELDPLDVEEIDFPTLIVEALSLNPLSLQ